jgi:hypothetical protein
MRTPGNRKRGPRPRPPELNRTAFIRLGLRPVEKVMIECAADAAGVSTAEWVRRIIVPEAQEALSKAEEGNVEAK